MKILKDLKHIFFFAGFARIFDVLMFWIHVVFAYLYFVWTGSIFASVFVMSLVIYGSALYDYELNEL